MILLGHDETVAQWVGSITGKPFHPPFTAIGSIDPEGHLTGGFVFTGYNGTSIEMSLAGHGVMNRGLWRAVMAYVFDQLACDRLEMRTATSNKHVRKLAPRFGFAYEGKSRRFYGREDAFVYSLVRDDLSSFRKRWRL
jgi:RimJ/RimL family protein N-acetyltransferase